MDKLFGIPTDRLTWHLLAVFGAGALILAALAARDRTSFRMALRNLSRRRTQTALIVPGLALATVLFSAAFTTGDTLTNSLRVQALEDIGRVDVVVKAKQPESQGGTTSEGGGASAREPGVRPPPSRTRATPTRTSPKRSGTGSPETSPASRRWPGRSSP